MWHKKINNKISHLTLSNKKLNWENLFLLQESFGISPRKILKKKSYLFVLFLYSSQIAYKKPLSTQSCTNYRRMTEGMDLACENFLWQNYVLIFTINYILLWIPYLALLSWSIIKSTHDKVMWNFYMRWSILDFLYDWN